MKRFLCGLKYIFIPVLCIFLMSHNTFAISEPVSFVTSGYHKVYFYGGSGLSCYANCDFTINNNADVGVPITMIDFFVNNGPYYKNQILKFDIVIWKVSSSTSLHANLNDLQTNNANLALYSYETENLDTNTAVVHIYLRVKNDFTINNNNIRLQHGSGNNIFMFYLQPTERMSAGNWSLWYPLNFNVDTQSIVNAINAKDYTNVINNVNNSINSVNNSINNLNSDVEDATQDAADDSATAGDQSSADAASATTGFISAIGGFVSAITNASPSNCNINANLTHLNLGVLDLCSMPVPSYITIIGSIIAIMLVIPFCIVMFNRFIGLFRSFQG